MSKFDEIYKKYKKNPDINILAKEYGVTRERIRQVIERKRKEVKSMKYIILPIKSYQSEPIEAKSADDALIEFATHMDTNMGLYFKAIPEDELASYLMDEELKDREKQFIDFASNELVSSFNVKDETVAEKIAKNAWEKYLKGDGETEYECIEYAYNKARIYGIK